MIIHEKVTSSAINSATYNTGNNMLTIEFKQGSKYDYPNVPREHYDGLIHAPSVGKYFNQHIKQYSAAKEVY